MLIQLEETPSLTIGSNNDGDHLTLQIVEMHEGDWIDVELGVVAGAFRGTLTTDDFLVGYFFTLRREFERLYHELSGEMKFETLEHSIKLQVKGNGRGNFNFWCRLGYPVQADFTPFSIEFALSFDQTYIPRFLRELDEIISHATRETTKEK